jgi:ubiquinone/menaquinone biosynthesis C-methylase UbiE
VYAAGRALSTEMKQVWVGAFSKWASPRRPLTVLDLGSGTGRFTPALAEAFGGPVYGVEPSERMRQVAEQTRHLGVHYLAGSAEAIPVPAGACDLVLMFLAFHHVLDRRAAVAEIRRVVRPGARVLLRSTFSDRMPDLLWHRFFPGARRVERQMFPSLTEVVLLFEEAGFAVVALDEVPETMAPSLAAYAERLRLRAISTFEHLDEEEIRRGFAALDRAVQAEDVPQLVTSDGDLLVLRAAA